ncbi:MAG: hypothetical protein JNK05_41910 [Myxococcales bacterium]|nr:hypothetical protein [Myxococcales bacterium]
MNKRAGIVFAAFAMVACSDGASSAQRRSAFPTRTQIQRLLRRASRMRPTAPVRTSSSLDRWTLEGPLPDRVSGASVQPTDPWSSFVREQLGERALPFTSELQCAAREIGRFVAQQGASPAGDVQGFIVARCGVTTANIAVGSLSATMQGSSESQLLAELRRRGSSLIEAPPDGATRMGVAFHRQGERAQLTVLYANSLLELAPYSMIPSSGRVELRGKLETPARSLTALVTDGANETRRCDVDRTVSLPDFALACPVSSADPTAVVELAALPPGRIVARSVARVLVRPSGVLADGYQRAVTGSAQSVAPSDFGRALLDQLNARRQSINLAPLAVDGAQALTNCSLAPVLMAEQLGFSIRSRDVDRAALGTIAGWDVDALVERGAFSSALGLPTRDPSAWLAATLLWPSSRATLLDAQATRVTVCAYARESSPTAQVEGVTWATYRTLDPSTIDRERDALRAVIDARRSARGLAPVRIHRGLDAIAQASAADLTAGRTTFDAALDGAVARLRERNLGAAASAASYDRAPEAELPEALVSQPSVRMGLGVAYYRAEGEPWAQCVMVVLIKR